MASDTLVSKRLHISGLTPSLTPYDLAKRLSSFGTVTALDGFGLADGVGQPRKFGYATLEATPAQLAKCVNVLSGTTWKGAKLRIGDAKPDFRERLEKERASAAEEPPKKKRRRAAAVHAADMSLVTPENAATRPGWKVTPMGRVVRPLRMRPARPLADPVEVKASKAAAAAGEVRRRKKRVKAPDARARRRMIDPTAWGSVHLKGMFLDVQGNARAAEEPEVDEAISEDESSGDESIAADIQLFSDKEEDDTRDIAADVARDASPAPDSTPRLPPKPTPTNAPPLPDSNIDVALEKAQSLSLLHSLFGDKGGTEWTGRESVGSDIDEDELRKAIVVDDADAGDIEEVPMETDDTPGGNASAAVGDDQDEDEDKDEETAEDTSEGLQATSMPPTKQQQQATKLKDLFAPQAEQAGFSLLGHLDLDLELDDDVLPAQAPASAAADLLVDPVPLSAPIAAPSTQVHLTLDPKTPLFFPHPSSFPSASTGPLTKAKARDLFDVAREGGWSWRDPAVGFWRTNTEVEVRARWESEKGELTREWKKRWREAGKIRRRRGAGVGDGE